MNFSSRLSALQAQLRTLECDALAVSHLTNVRYECGFSGSSGMLLVARDEVVFLTDFRYQNQAAQQIGELAKVVVASTDLWKEATQIVDERGWKRLGFEAEHVSVASHQDLQKRLKDTAETVATSRAVEKLRERKDEGELEIIREAVRVADETFAEVLGLVKPGARELDIALEIERAIRARGGSGTSFETIVASGKRSALPHGVASEKRIENGDLVTIDMGAKFGGYCSDMTRTVCVGESSPEQRAIYELVYRAQVAACEAIRPGLECAEADKIARDIIDEAGHKDHFGHGLGHGVGIDIHEAPRLSKLGKGRIEAGQIVTCEPGVYVENFGGVRIEDMLFVTENGAEILTQTPKPATLLEI